MRGRKVYSLVAILGIVLLIASACAGTAPQGGDNSGSVVESGAESVQNEALSQENSDHMDNENSEDDHMDNENSKDDHMDNENSEDDHMDNENSSGEHMEGDEHSEGDEHMEDEHMEGEDDDHGHGPDEHMAGAHDVPEEAAEVPNPIAFSDESVAAGAEIYTANCAACHGDEGEGDGPAAVALEKPPADLHEDHVQDLSDGALFYIITHGRAETPMPAWEEVLDEDQRWNVVNFLRTFE